MNAHALLNLLNPLEKRIRCINYLYHNICRSVNTNTNVISMLVYHILLHKAQTQHDVIYITGF